MNELPRSPSDRDALTVSEAYRLFTPRSDHAAMVASIQGISSQVADLVPRAEQQQRWDRDDERYSHLEVRMREDRESNARALEKIDSKVDVVLRNQLPKWVLPLVVFVVGGIVIPVLVVIANHYWK